jgi:hypothetical protein
MPTGRTPHRDTFSYASWVLDRIEATRRLTHLAIAGGALSPALGLPGWRCSTDRTSLREKSLLSGNLTGNFAILGIPKAIPDRESAVLQRLFEKFAERINRENSWVSREISEGIRELLSKRPPWTTKSILPNMATISVGANWGFHRARHGPMCRAGYQPALTR